MVVWPKYFFLSIINHLGNAVSVWMTLTDYRIKRVINPKDYHQIIIT